MFVNFFFFALSLLQKRLCLFANYFLSITGQFNFFDFFFRPSCVDYTVVGNNNNNKLCPIKLSRSRRFIARLIEYVLRVEKMFQFCCRFHIKFASFHLKSIYTNDTRFVFLLHKPFHICHLLVIAFRSNTLHTFLPSSVMYLLVVLLCVSLFVFFGIYTCTGPVYLSHN